MKTHTDCFNSLHIQVVVNVKRIKVLQLTITQCLIVFIIQLEVYQKPQEQCNSRLFTRWQSKVVNIFNCFTGSDD